MHELVDAWRQIAVSANALLGVFNVRYQADLLSPLGEAKPLALGGSGYRQRLILSGELPLVRLPERNVIPGGLDRLPAGPPAGDVGGGPHPGRRPCRT